MAVQIFTGNVIAVIWDFDQTLIPGYQQTPIFEHFGVDEGSFWKEVEKLAEYYEKQGVIVSPDTIYLNHILSYVKEGKFPGLSNKLLMEFGRKLHFYDGLPDFMRIAKEYIETKDEFSKRDISVEHYIVSTGLRQIIKGSLIAKFVTDIWACEFIEYPAKPGFVTCEAAPKEGEKTNPEICQVGYFLDNSTKTRAIWEINKGTNKNPSIGVNFRIAPEDRRVPIPNMIYIADGPSDIPVFSILNQFGGRTLGVYNPKSKQHFSEVKKLEDQGRVQHFCPANYVEGSDAHMWILNSLEEIGNRIVEIHNRILTERIGKPTKHVL